MNNPETLVSIIVPAFNAERYLHQTLASLDLQTYKNLEIILVDDGSQDATYEIASNFQKSNNRLRIFRQQHNEGESAAINLGWVHAKGKFVCIISHDDPQDLEWLTFIMNFIEKDPSHILYYSDRMKIDSTDKFVSFDRLYEWSLQTLIGKMICIASTGTLINKSLLPIDFLPRDTRLKQCSDLKQMLTLAQYGNGCKVKGVYSKWRIHSTNLSYSKPFVEKADEFETFTVNWLDEFYPNVNYPYLNAHAGIYIALQLIKWAFQQLHFHEALEQIWLKKKTIKHLILRSGKTRFFQTVLVIVINKALNKSYSWFGKIPREFSKHSQHNW
jgi:glycosyltransferase involved in cell wall biosynthesis